MEEETLRGRINGNQIDLETKSIFRAGTEVTVTFQPTKSGPVSELLEALDALPKVTRDDVELFLALIREGSRSALYGDPFEGILDDEG
jgi:hypothetical protein